mgnify:CR=1 FL=1
MSGEEAHLAHHFLLEWRVGGEAFGIAQPAVNHIAVVL